MAVFTHSFNFSINLCTKQNMCRQQYTSRTMQIGVAHFFRSHLQFSIKTNNTPCVHSRFTSFSNHFSSTFDSFVFCHRFFPFILCYFRFLVDTISLIHSSFCYFKFLDDWFVTCRVVFYGNCCTDIRLSPSSY